MISRVSPGWFAAMLVVSSCLVSVPVCAQSLSLSYRLDVSSVHLQRVSISNDTCAAVSWVATVATCARADALGRFSWSTPADEEGTRSQPVGTGEKAAAVGSQPSEASEVARGGRELTPGPATSLSSADAHLRPAAAGDGAAASLKPDVTLRLASKKKARSADDEANYSDAALQNRSQKNNFNSLGVELLIPFH